MTAREQATTTVTPEQLGALDERVNARIFREAERASAATEELRRDMRSLVRTSLAQLRADLAREVVTERLAIVDEYRREWIRTAFYSNGDSVQLEIEHPDRKLGVAVHLGVNDEGMGSGDAYVHLAARGNGVGILRAEAGQPDTDGATVNGASLWMESETRDRAGKSVRALEDTIKPTSERTS